jgi:hypothetical protein
MNVLKSNLKKRNILLPIAAASKVKNTINNNSIIMTKIISLRIQVRVG